MFLRPIVIILLTILTGLWSSCSNVLLTEKEIITRAKDIHYRILTLDTHIDIVFNYATPEADPGKRKGLQVTLPKMVEGGLDAGFFIVYVAQTKRTPPLYEAAQDSAMKNFNAIHRIAEEMYPDIIEIAYTADDVERIAETEKRVAVIGIENGFVIGKDISLIKKYYEKGGRYITLSHYGHNDICDSSNPNPDLGDDESEHNGVSEFGRQVIAEMNRLGIMVDVSHTSKKSMLDAIKLSKAPIIGSHSGCKVLCDHPRNMDDEQLVALKENGGVIQIVAVNFFVKKVSSERDQALVDLRKEFDFPEESRAVYRMLDEMIEEKRAEYDVKEKEIDERFPPVNIKDFVDHIDHVVKLIGIDYVGIGSDFDGGGGVKGWRDASESLNVTIELVRRGYTEEEIAKVWGQNLLRVWRAVERTAHELQSSAGN